MSTELMFPLLLLAVFLAAVYVWTALLTVMNNTLRQRRESKQEAESPDGDSREVEKLEGVPAENQIFDRPSITPAGSRPMVKVFSRGDLEQLMCEKIAQVSRMGRGRFQFHVIYMHNGDGCFIGARVEMARATRQGRGRSGGR